MLRQRIRARRSPLALIGRALVVLLSLILIWYGLMLLLLALKVSPDTVESISGYRSIYDSLAGIEQGDITDDVRLVTAISGLAAFLLFGYVAFKELPRPYLARGDLSLPADERGTLQVEPRAIERVAETAAADSPSVTAAAGRYGGADLAVSVHVSRPRDAPETLRDVQRRVTEALGRHELPELPVSVTLTGFDPQQRRDLS